MSNLNSGNNKDKDKDKNKKKDEDKNKDKDKDKNKEEPRKNKRKQSSSEIVPVPPKKPRQIPIFIIDMLNRDNRPPLEEGGGGSSDESTDEDEEEVWRHLENDAMKLGNESYELAYLDEKLETIDDFIRVGKNYREGKYDGGFKKYNINIRTVSKLLNL